MGNINLFLDDDDIAAAQAASQFAFVIPADAVKRGNLDDPNDDKAKAQWMQKLEIIESKVYEDTVKDKDQNTYACVTFEVAFQVPADAVRNTSGSGFEADPNAGKQHRAWYRVVPNAMKNKSHPKYKANNYSLGRLNGLVRAVYGTNALPHGVRTDLAQFFSGDAAPVLGKVVVANVKARRYEGDRQDELTDFVPLEMVNG